jgi:hypothetical protein
MMAAAVARLMKAFAAQVERLRRLKNGGSQFVRVENVNDWGRRSSAMLAAKIAGETISSRLGISVPQSLS